MDLKFLDDALNGRFTMKEGVEITAEVETLEENEGGVWIPKRRSILKVLRRNKSKKDKGQPDLFAPAKKPKAASKKKKPSTPKKRPPPANSAALRLRTAAPMPQAAPVPNL